MENEFKLSNEQFEKEVAYAKKQKEFNLSEKIEQGCNHYEFEKCIFLKDVKEFIKRLKEELEIIDGSPDVRDLKHYWKLKIDKLAGDDLI